jgi:hypothetical protein
MCVMKAEMVVMMVTVMTVMTVGAAVKVVICSSIAKTLI